MQQCNRFNEYLKTVCEQIRWKKAHTVISEELQNHLEDQKDAFVSEGLDEREAEQKAVKEMGDPVVIGAEFDRAYRPKIEWRVLLLCVAFLVLGILSNFLIEGTNYLNFSIVHDAAGIFLGLSALTAAYFIDFSFIGKYSKYIYIGLIVLFIVLLIQEPRINGRKAFASYLLLLFPLIFSGIVYKMRNKGIQGILLCGLLFLIILFLGLRVPSAAGVLIAGISGMIILTYAVMKNWFGIGKKRGLLAVYIPVTILSGIFLSFIAQYAMHRISVLINPYLEPEGAGFIGILTRNILGNARFIGKGTEFLPFCMTRPSESRESDYVLTYLISQYGWIVFIFIALLLGLFIFRCIVTYRKQKSFLGQLVCVSVISTFTLQYFCFIIGNLGLTFLFEFPLPLFSGNISTVINLFLIGMMLSVFRNGCLYSDKSEAKKESKLFELSDGKLTIHLRG